MKKRDEIISRLNALNEKIGEGQRDAPGVVDGNNLVVNMKYYTKKQRDELVSIVAEWGFKIEQEIMNNLLEKKVGVEAMLARTFEEGL